MTSKERSTFGFRRDATGIFAYFIHANAIFLCMIQKGCFFTILFDWIPFCEMMKFTNLQFAWFNCFSPAFSIYRNVWVLAKTCKKQQGIGDGQEGGAIWCDTI